MALTKITGEGVGSLDAITIGDGTAADKKILFDGNAQDFHIGLDDSNDSLTIGLGSTLGTTSYMVIDANGHVTKPLQPAFSVHKNGTDQNDYAADTEVTVTFSHERFDQNGDFNTSTSTFTAPVTGKYFLSATVRTDQMDTGANFYVLSIKTSNETYRGIIDPNFSSDLSYFTERVSLLADMDANDTAYVFITQSGGTQQADIDGNEEYTYFTGHLEC